MEVEDGGGQAWNRRRKPWMSEDYRMAIFDGIATGVAVFYLRPHTTKRAFENASSLCQLLPFQKK